MKDFTEQIYDELNAQVVRMLEHSLNQASRIAELESRIEFNGDHSQDGIVKRDERIADLERQLRNAKFAENLDAEDKAFFASLRAPSAPAVEQPICHISKGMLEQLRERLGVSGYVQSGRTEEFPVALYTTPQAADTDKVRDGVLVGTLCLGEVEGNELGAWDIDTDTKAIDALQLELVRTTRPVFLELYAKTPSMAAQAPVREVPGYKLVPIEATEDMQVAFLECWFSKRRGIDDDIGDAYAELLAAAPLPAAPVQPNTDKEQA